jgi:hypothetical protein
MRKLLLVAGIVALAACGQREAAPAENADMNAAESNMDAAATPAAFQLTETSWTFTDKDGQPMQESIDANGNYILNSGDKHIDHGTSVMKGDKACFTSAMNNDGEDCWTTQPVEVGQSMDTTSDKGEKLTVTRVAYTPLTMPAG